MFEPIAIVGRACVLPGALTAEQLWQNIIHGVSSLNDATEQTWGMNPYDLLANGQLSSERVSTLSCGFIQGFESIFNAKNFAISSNAIMEWDVLLHWLLHVGREALTNAGLSINRMPGIRAGAVIGNLGYPTKAFGQLAESVWLKPFEQSPKRTINPENRFMTGLPIFKFAEGLGLTLDSYAIDAACASSLYAIKLACDQLQDGNADLMLAGGINAADSLFLQMGFSALHALSKTGRSLPFHQHADGLIPSQGAAVVVLKRLEDALADRDLIYGVIRGVGLSNDGAGKGLLAPNEAGQIAAMQQAYELSSIDPGDVSWVECHATGTPLGDQTEIQSMRQLFDKKQQLSLGAMKANIGHTITASGAAALINVLSAFQHGIKPPSLTANAELMPLLHDNGFSLLSKPEKWERHDKPRTAAINCFGFGGNNAHLLVQEWDASLVIKKSVVKSQPRDPIAIVGIGVVAGNVQNKTEFVEVLKGDRTAMSEEGAHISSIPLPVQDTPFPPMDLRRTLGQQLATVKASQEALSEIKMMEGLRTSVLVGMQCDAEITRCGLRWRLETLLPAIQDKQWFEQMRDSIHPAVQSADIVGCMPNIVTNRLNYMFDFKSPSYSVCAEEKSGQTALKIVMRDLQNNAIDMAVVGAVDMCCEPIHRIAAEKVLGSISDIAGDAAVVFVLKRLSDAEKSNETIYATFDHLQDIDQKYQGNASETISKFGYSHAASGLLNIASHNLAKKIKPTIYIYSGNNKTEVLKTLNLHSQSYDGPAKLVCVAHDDIELKKQHELANIFLSQEKSPTLLPQGMYFQEKPADGELAFVFTGALTTYKDMGHDLLVNYPSLLEPIASQVKSLPTILKQFHSLPEKTMELSMLEELKMYSLLTQVHAQFTQTKLHLKPYASIGYCSGETNALFAFNAWNDMEQLFMDVDNEGIYTKSLGGEYTVLNNKNWQSWRVLHDVNEIAAMLKTETGVRLTIINSPKDCIIAGYPDDCLRFLNKLPHQQVRELPHSMVIHCDEFSPVSKLWYDLHYRVTQPVSNVAFYSTGTGKPYLMSAHNAAQALLDQASYTVNFPQVIQNAWESGVRVFLEHGPRNLCSRWINEILGDKPHLAIPMDVMGVNSLTQAAYATAQLIAAGVISHEYAVLK